MNKTEQHKKAVIEALEKSLGIVTVACKTAGVGRTQFYNWLKDDPKFKKDVESISDITLDFVESQLHQKIAGVKALDKAGEKSYKKEPDTTAIIFYLKTKGKRRGYVERTEVETKETNSFTNYSEDELNEKIEDIMKGDSEKKN